MPPLVLLAMMIATDYGARPDGVSDCTAALQTVLTLATRDGRGSTVFLPRGDYKITNTLTVPSVVGARLLGDGRGSRLVWAGPPDRPLLRLVSNQGTTLTDFTIIGTVAAPLAVGIQMLSQAGAPRVSTQNVCHNLLIDGGTTGVGIGIQIGGPLGDALNVIDANNDFHSIDHCHLANFTDTGLLLANTQVYNVRCVNTLILANGRGQYGVQAISTPPGQGGNCQWTGGMIGGCLAADFRLSPFAAPYTIRDATFEGSARFIDVWPGPSSPMGLIVVEGCRWAANGVHADRQFIRYGMPGILWLRGNHFGDSSQPGSPLQIHWNPAGETNLRRVILDNNTVRYQPFTYPGLPPTSDVGTVVYQS